MVLCPNERAPMGCGDAADDNNGVADPVPSENLNQSEQNQTRGKPSALNADCFLKYIYI